MTDEQRREGAGSATTRREEGEQLRGLRGRVAAGSVTFSAYRKECTTMVVAFGIGIFFFFAPFLFLVWTLFDFQFAND